MFLNAGKESLENGTIGWGVGRGRGEGGKFFFSSLSSSPTHNPACIAHPLDSLAVSVTSFHVEKQSVEKI